jgi:hypothetical protein
MEFRGEYIEDLEMLEPGDVIIYPGNGKMKSARVLKKPVPDGKHKGFYKTIKCEVFVEQHSFKDYVLGRIEYYDVQKFNLEQFNKVKYLQLNQKNVIRVIK